MDVATAREVSARALEVARLLDDSVAVVVASASPDDAASYKQAVGKVMAELLLEIVNPLYREHPELKPDGLFIPHARGTET
jgi:hypothetical protein